jgi:hypothetical protein
MAFELIPHVASLIICVRLTPNIFDSKTYENPLIIESLFVTTLPILIAIILNLSFAIIELCKLIGNRMTALACVGAGMAFLSCYSGSELYFLVAIACAVCVNISTIYV